MDDGFEMPTHDTVPITTISNGGEVTPLKESLNSTNIINTRPENSTNTTGHQKTESVGKYKNLESDVQNTNNATKVSDVQIRFNSNGNGPSNTGSTWSLNSSTASSGTSVIRWYRHPKVQEHWKVVAISFVLFFIGLCLCIAGVVLEALRVQLGGIFMLFVIGIICFIPGVYHVIAVYCAVKGKRGFSFYNLPLFN